MSPIYFDAYTRFGPVQRLHGKHPWSFQHMLDELNHCSISAAMVASTAQLYYDSMFENLRLCEKLADYDWLWPIWTTRPHWTAATPEPVKFVELMRKHDVRAVQLFPKTESWPLLSRHSESLLRELEESGALVIINYIEETNAMELEQLAERYPRLKLLVRSISWNFGGEIVPLVLHHKNVHITFDRFQINNGLEFFTQHGCEDQLLFSSNAPNMSAGAHRLYVDYADVSAEVKQKIAGGNLMRLIGETQLPKERVNADEDEIMAEARQGKPLSTLVLDLHAHILDEGLQAPQGSYMMIDGGPGGVVKLNRRLGVDGIGLMSWNGAPGVHTEQGNQCVRDAMDAYPDYFWGLATFDTPHDSAEVIRGQMEALFEDKRFLGLKPYQAFGIPYDDPSHDVWWQFGSERGLYALLHPIKGYITPEFESVCSRYPDLTVLAAHVGGSYEYADFAIELSRRFPKFHCEITYTPVCGGIVDYLVEGCGADRVIYGSDLPMRDPRQQLGWVVYSRMSVDKKKLVLGGNGKRIVDGVREAQG